MDLKEVKKMDRIVKSLEEAVFMHRELANTQKVSLDRILGPSTDIRSDKDDLVDPVGSIEKVFTFLTELECNFKILEDNTRRLQGI